MSKQVWFNLREETENTIYDDITAVSGAISHLPQSHRDMSDSSPQNSQGVPRLDLNNHTQSTSDSRDEDSTQNDVSSPSMHRGFSSDDNSGWKSETTETSEGNFSLSQYPLDDPSCGEESPQENSSLHEEALTSAITEVSKDFISGNFSPGKYPAVESDSSDGDHHLDGHLGAVYARYPETAAGMSDCDWNPYGTDNDNETPRSSSSESESKKAQPINTTSSIKQKEIEIRIPTGSIMNGDLVRVSSIPNPSGTRDFVRIPNNTKGNGDPIGESKFQTASRDFARIPLDAHSKQAGNDNNILDKTDQRTHIQNNNSKSETVSRDPVPSSHSQLNIVSDSYAMYSPDKELIVDKAASEKTSTTSTLLGSSDHRSCLQTGNQYIPSSHREMYDQLSDDKESNVKRHKDVTRQEMDNNLAERKVNVVSEHSSSTIIPESHHTQVTTETGFSSSSADPSRREVNGRYGSSSSSQTLQSRSIDPSRREVDGRYNASSGSSSQILQARSLDLPRREVDGRCGSSSSSQTSQANYIPVAERSKLLGLPEDYLNPPKPSSSTDFAVPRVTDIPLLSRVQIPEKDTLSSSSNGKSESMSMRVSKLLEEASQLGTTLHHHLYSREALGLDGEREPTILRSYSPMRRSDNLGEKSTERSLTPGSGLLKSGEQSIRSSLGEEVAKLMVPTDNGNLQNLSVIPSNLNNVPLNIGNVPSNKEQMNAISSQTYPSLATATIGGGPGSTDSQESGDSLSQRVKKILSDTAYVDHMRSGQGKIEYSTTTTQNNLDYSRLQRDLQDIQNSLEPVVEYNRESAISPDISKTSDKSIESTKSHKLLWDHGADLGYDDSLGGRFMGTMKTDTEAECESTFSGKGYNGLSDTLELVGKSQKDTTEVVSDQVESDVDEKSMMILAPDVEEIIRRYQTEKHDPEPLLEAGDNSGLASRVMKILSQEPPRKQARGILESARQEEREMIEKMTDKPPKLDSSVDSQASTNSSFVIHDKDVRKQLEWSEMSGIDKSVNSSYLSGIKTQPFSALGNAKTFLSSQLAKNADRTFNHSIDLKTPYRHVIDCYPLYGVERTRGAAEIDQFGRTEPDGVKEAWPDNASGQDIPTEQLLGATSDGTANIRPGSRDHQRTYSDPRELSPEPKVDSTADVAMETEDGHTRSKSEEPRYGDNLTRDRFYNLDSVPSTSDRRLASSPLEEQKEEDKPTDVRKKEITVTTPPSDSSPGSAGQLSSDSDNSSKRREAGRLRPYRPHGSRELYYTEDGEDSMTESVTTVESNHTVGGNSTMESTHSGLRRVTWNPSIHDKGSDDAIGPHFPSQYLGSRTDGPPSMGGIYGTRNPEKKDALSTIDEKSVADDREKSGTDSGVDNPRSDLMSSHGSTLSSYRKDPARDSRADFTSRNTGHSEDKLTLSTRSDPGDQYATPKRSTRNHDHSDPRSDSRVYRDSLTLDHREVGPVKSRSETDLATLPDVHHKYSSPMHGDRFMELSTQPSPIYSHHTSMASPAVFGNGVNRDRNLDSKLLEERLNMKPLEKGPDFSHVENVTNRSGELSQRESADGMNRDDQPGSTPYNKGYDIQRDDSLPPLDRREPFRTLEPGIARSDLDNQESLELRNARSELNHEPVRHLDKGYEIPQRVYSEEVNGREQVRPLDRGPDFQYSEQNAWPVEQGQFLMDINTNPPLHVDTINPGSRPTDRVMDYVRDDRHLNRGPSANEVPKERRSLEKGPNYYDMYRPRKDPQPRSNHHIIIDDDTEELEFRELPRRTSTPYECPDPDFEDMVKEEKAKIQIEYELQRRLKQKGYLQNSTDEKEFGAEYDHVPPNERAKSLQRKLEQESHRELPPNINDLWQKFQEMNQNESTSSLNSSRIGAITDLLKNPTKHIVQKITDERTYEKAKERRIMQELAEKAREEQRRDTRGERKRQELQNLRRLSEEESNGSYAEILQQEQRKKQGKHKNETSKPETKVDGKQKKEMENKMKGSKKAKIDIPVHGDSIDTLYSIPEDASFEVTPSKVDDSNPVTKSKKSRQRHVIDPLMNKLKDKIESQRQKIDKERRKEMKRLDKLKKLEMLLTAKKKGKLSDQAIDVELQYVSSTSAAASSESSTLFGSDTTISANSVDNKDSFDSQAATGDTTSTKDSSIEIQKVRTKKVKHSGMLDAYMASIGQGGRADDSEASTDDLMVVRKIKSPKPGKVNSEKKKKDKKNRTESRVKVNSEKDYYDAVPESRQGSDSQRRERSKSPKARRLKDAATMVPSPIVKSPVTKRKARDVYVRSEAVQTSPFRSWSPPREDQAVISVPLMSSPGKREVKPFDSRQQRQRSYSPTDQYSCSSIDQSSVLSRSVSPPSHSRTSGKGGRSACSKSPPKPRHAFLSDSQDDSKQMKVSPPPKSRMFTPETPDDDLAGKVKDSPNDKKQRLRQKGLRTGGLSWFVPMAESKPWKKSSKDRQAFAVSQEPWQPRSVSSAAWKAIVADNPVNKSIGESTNFDLDTTGHYKELDEERSDEENFDPKPLSRLTLQEAFQTYKQDAISRLRARQKRVVLAANERNLQEMLEQERNRLFSEEKRRKEANPEAHPLSENLYKPKKRAMSKGEMKELTEKLYKKLPEVQNQKLQEKRQDDYSLNRLRAKVFNRRIQRNTLKKIENRRKRSPSKNHP